MALPGGPLPSPRDIEAPPPPPTQPQPLQMIPPGAHPLTGGPGDRDVHDVDGRRAGDVQTLEVTPITKYSESQFVLGRQIAVNNSYLCYENIKVVMIHTARRALFRAHTQRVTDMAFFSEDVHLLASVSIEGRLYIWKISEGPDEDQGTPQIIGNVMLAVQIVVECLSLHPRVCWHSNKQEVLLLGFGKYILRFDTTKFGKGEVFSAEEPLKFSIDKLIDGVQLVGNHDGEITDLSMSQWMTTCLVSASMDGTVKVWEDKKAQPLAVLRPHDGQPVNAAMFLTAPSLPDHTILLTAGQLNQEVKIWASDSKVESWKCTQTLELKSSAETRVEDSFFNQVVALPQAGLLLLANAKRNPIYAVHLEYGMNPALTRMNYIVEFTPKIPILSFPGTIIAPHGENILQVYSVQTDGIQQYALDVSQCLPPRRDGNIGGGLSSMDPSSSRLPESAQEQISDSTIRHPVGSNPPEGVIPGEASTSSNIGTKIIRFLEWIPFFVLFAVFLAIVQLNNKQFNLYEDINKKVQLSYFTTVTLSLIGFGDVVPRDYPDAIAITVTISCFLLFWCGVYTIYAEILCKIVGDAHVYIWRKMAQSEKEQLHNIGIWGLNSSRDDLKEGAKFLLAICFIFLLSVVSICICSALENIPLVKSIYLVSTSLTTTGYGNFAFKTERGQIFATFFLLLAPPLLIRASSCVARILKDKMVNCFKRWFGITTPNNHSTDPPNPNLHQPRSLSNSTPQLPPPQNPPNCAGRIMALFGAPSLPSPLGIETPPPPPSQPQSLEMIPSTIDGMSCIEPSVDPSHAGSKDSESSRDLLLKASESSVSTATVPAQTPNTKSKKKGKGSQASSPSQSLLNSTDSTNETPEVGSPQILAMQESINQLIAMQKEAQKQMSVLIAVAVTKDGRRLETAFGRALEKTIKANNEALWARFQEENTKNEKLSRDRTQLISNSVSNSIIKDLPSILERTTKKKLAVIGPAVARTITPTIEKTVSSAVSESFQRGVGDKAVNLLDKSVNTKIEATVARQIQAQFQTSGKQALQDGYFESLVIPAFETSCKAMFEQVDATLQKGIAEHTAASQQQFDPAHTPLALTLREAINAASSVTKTLSGELADGQRKVIALATAGANASGVNLLVSQLSNGPLSGLNEKKAEAPLDLTKERSRLVSERKYEEVFA